MREKLIQYINLLFAGTDCEEVRDEILQNTLDRYDDLISQGKQPEAAYRLAIGGIGDINEILSSEFPTRQTTVDQEDEAETTENRLKHAVSVAMYILSAIPLVILSEFGYDTIGLCITLVLVAAATALRLTMKRTKKTEKTISEMEVPPTPRQELRKSVDGIIWAIGLALYVIISFATQAWMITWIIFPLIGAVQGLVKAIMDLKEASKHEN